MEVWILPTSEAKFSLLRLIRVEEENLTDDVFSWRGWSLFIGNFRRKTSILLRLSTSIAALWSHINSNCHFCSPMSLPRVTTYFLAWWCYSLREFPSLGPCTRCLLQFTSFFLPTRDWGCLSLILMDELLSSYLYYLVGIYTRIF